MMYYGYSWMWLLMLIVPVLLIGLIVYVVVRLAQNNNAQYAGGRNDALEILNQRFARGDISEEEYVQKKKLLKE